MGQRNKKIISVSGLSKFYKEELKILQIIKTDSCSQGLEPNSACKDRGEESSKRVGSELNSGGSYVIIAQRWPTKVRNRKRTNGKVSGSC